jgi:hypothetical protein
MATDPTPATPATPPSQPGKGDDAKETDANLPDPSAKSKWWALRFLLVAVGLALFLDVTGWDNDPAFDPTKVKDADLAIFAGFFAAAAIIERLIELLGPFIPWWDYPGKDLADTAARPPKGTIPATDPLTQAAIAQKKADRGYTILTLAVLMGVVASAATGLYLAEVIGMSLVRTGDILVSAVAISGGTKGLHELIKSLQKAKGSGSTAG